MVFHHINAYEEEGHLVFDMICYVDSSLYDMFYIQNFRHDFNSFVQANEKSFTPPTCKRFVLPLGVNKVRLVPGVHSGFLDSHFCLRTLRVWSRVSGRS